ncbi:MAG: hypothetical protein KIG32_00165 [Ruminiclostridium sp.]|nr:hypothetical protein [Ruminiclostridium sp.]
MKKALIFLTAAAAIGTGYILAKKYIEKNPETVAAVKANCSEKLHKASVYCTGAVQTGSEKLTKSVNNLVAAGKEKTSEIIKKAATTGTAFKNEINNLKDMVVSINSGVDVDISEDDSNKAELEFKEEDTDVQEITELPEEGSEAL